MGSLSLLQGIFPTQGLNLGIRHRSPILYHLSHQRSPKETPVAQLVKNWPAMRETQVQILGWEHPLQKGKATHSNILA